MKFDDIEIKGSKFHSSKSLISINNVDIYKIATSDKFASGKKHFKYFIVYKNDRVVTLLCIKLPKIVGYVKSFDKAKCISLWSRINSFWEIQ